MCSLRLIFFCFSFNLVLFSTCAAFLGNVVPTYGCFGVHNTDAHAILYYSGHWFKREKKKTHIGRDMNAYILLKQATTCTSKWESCLSCLTFDQLPDCPSPGFSTGLPECSRISWGSPRINSQLRWLRHPVPSDAWSKKLHRPKKQSQEKVSETRNKQKHKQNVRKGHIEMFATYCRKECTDWRERFHPRTWGTPGLVIYYQSHQEWSW